jgi:hypothetical protein
MTALTTEHSCPYCHTPVGAHGRACERCDSAHHPDCWQENAGCAVPGCGVEVMAAAAPVHATAHAQGASMGMGGGSGGPLSAGGLGPDVLAATITPAHPAPDAAQRSSRRAVIIVGLLIAVVVGIPAAGIIPLPEGGDRRVALGDPPGTEEEPEGRAETAPESELSAAPSTSAPAPASAPRQRTQPVHRPDTPSWIVVINSIEPQRGRRAAERKSSRYAGMGISTEVLRSDDYNSLNPGYWVVYAGPFNREAPAAAYCRSIRSRVGNCYQRFLDR